MAPNRWSFAGYDFLAKGLIARPMEGYAGLPPTRGEDVPTPGLSGRRHTPFLDDARRFGLGLWIPDPPHDRLQELAKLFANRRTLRELANTRPDGTVVSAYAKVVDWQPIDVSRVDVLYGGVADFLLPDPWFYGPDVNQVVPIGASPTNFTFTHPGTVRGDRFVLDFTGPITNPRLTNNTTGVHVEVLTAVAAGQHLVVDGEQFTAANNGVNTIGNVRHAGAVPWMVAEPGPNSMSVTGTGLGAGTSLAIVFRPPFV